MTARRKLNPVTRKSVFIISDQLEIHVLYCHIIKAANKKWIKTDIHLCLLKMWLIIITDEPKFLQLILEKLIAQLSPFSQRYKIAMIIMLEIKTSSPNSNAPSLESQQVIKIF